MFACFAWLFDDPVRALVFLTAGYFLGVATYRLFGNGK